MNAKCFYAKIESEQENCTLHYGLAIYEVIRRAPCASKCNDSDSISTTLAKKSISFFLKNISNKDLDCWLQEVVIKISTAVRHIEVLIMSEKMLQNLTNQHFILS